MSSLLEGSEQLEQELTPEPWKRPAAGSVALHLGLVTAIIAYGILGGFFKHSLWGVPGQGAAIEVNLVSSAIPLPTSQPVNKNVLATETPSEAPAPPETKSRQKVDEEAIPISGRQKKKQEKTTRRIPPQKQEQVQTNRARYGEQAGTSMPRSAASQGFSSGPTTVANADFGNLFGYYVEQINRKMSQNSFRSMVDPQTPRGAKAYIYFKIYRDGSVGDVQLEQTSGSSTLDTACVRAAQRVDTFGTLPSGYRGSYLQVSFYCEY